MYMFVCVYVYPLRKGKGNERQKWEKSEKMALSDEVSRKRREEKRVQKMEHSGRRRAT